MATPEELGGLRRVVRVHLGVWGLPDLVDSAQLCVTELVTNVITHVGPGTPTTLAVSMNGTHLRIEIHDPDPQALPTLVAAKGEAEAGRGLVLVDATAERWGVILRADSKVTWCELATGLPSPNGHMEGPRVAKAEALLGLYCWDSHLPAPGAGQLGVGRAQQAAIGMIVDILHWFRAHGCDPDEALDRAQSHFEEEISERTCSV
ncbi:ATP-binding protein [Streptomyces sp. NPDC060064]|uniref:ATP-binding protein n=1 Tax=Streptomyces sp. NPDC060064 TaxID=3347049 RepID=UPI0036A001FC